MIYTHIPTIKTPEKSHNLSNSVITNDLERQLKVTSVAKTYPEPMSEKAAYFISNTTVLTTKYVVCELSFYGRMQIKA